MRLYLARHGRAMPTDENPNQPLSDSGRADVERMASFLARSGARAAHVYHSGKTRAAETALLLADVLGPGRVVEELPGIHPMDDPETLVRAADTWREDTIVVGHNPYMERTLARLLTGGDSRIIAAFPTATVCCLERQDDGVWVMHWHATPTLLGV